MTATTEAAGSPPPRTTTERTSERELVITRTVKGQQRLVFEAWATPELFRQWWVPPSFGITLIDFEADIRTGGSYRLTMGHPASDQPMTFFGRYLEVVAPSRIVWTNEEAGEAGQVTTVTFEDAPGEATRVVVHELYPTKQALDDALADGSTSAWDEQLGQLETLVARTAPAGG